MSGWFKAGTRAHYADAAGERSLCGKYVAEGPLVGIHALPARQCSLCARRQAEQEAESWRLARTPAGPAPAPMAVGPVEHPLDQLQALSDQEWREKRAKRGLR